MEKVLPSTGKIANKEVQKAAKVANTIIKNQVEDKTTEAIKEIMDLNHYK